MKKIRWALVLAGVAAIGGMISGIYYHHDRNGDDYAERKAFIERDVLRKCSIAKERLLAFRTRFPRSTDVTKTKAPEKIEWESVQSAQRDCQAIQTLLDSPLPIESYQRDAEKACGELKKRQESFNQRFPTEESQKDNDAILSSPEWKAMMEWRQACDTARADLDEAKERFDHEKRAADGMSK